MSPLQDVLAAIVMLCGAAVQGAVGFGLNLVAAPLLILINPELVPAPAIMASFVLNVLVVRREKGTHFWRTMRWPIIAAIPGSIAGAAVVKYFVNDGLTIIFGVLILIGVGLTASGLHIRRTRATLSAAGTMSGFMGTAVGIGGPPIALLYSNSSGPEIRGSLSRFFAANGIISIVLLAAFGQVSREDIGMALLLVPGVIIGYAISGWLARRVNRAHVRVAVLTISSLSAVVAIIRVIVT